MVVAAQNHAPLMVVASVIILTSVFSLKSFSTTGVFKVEEWTVLHKGNAARSRMHKPENRLDHNVRANFVICNDCFWCASQIMAGNALERCPQCKKSNLETMPVSLNEAYFFYRDEKRGIDLLFRKDSGMSSSTQA